MPETPEGEVVELRQYTLRPGGLDPLLDLFDRHLLQGQRDVGMRIGAMFRDLDDPDRFVWLRSFADLERRREALEAFYGRGPVWAEHGPSANATMLDSDDVLLLRPTEPLHVGAAIDEEGSAVHLAVWVHDGDPRVEERLAATVPDVVADQLGVPVTAWRSHPGPNTWPRLPVRPDRAFVWAAPFADLPSLDAGLVRLEGSAAWERHVAPDLATRVTEQRLRLEPVLTVPSTHRTEE